MLAGAEPYHHDGGPVGVLVCHGFTGTPQGVRPWAEYLARHGFSVRLPLLPGHGTRWQDLRHAGWASWYDEIEKTFGELRLRCDHVFVMGLSMGGALALRLAARHGPEVTGLVLVNPSLTRDRKALLALPILKRLLRSVKGLGGDIKKPGVAELAYRRVPLSALESISRLWSAVAVDLPDLTHPMLVFRSAEDHVVTPASVALLRQRAHAARIEERLCENSYHVATLDNDAERIFAGSVAFIRQVCGARMDGRTWRPVPGSRTAADEEAHVITGRQARRDGMRGGMRGGVRGGELGGRLR